MKYNGHSKSIFNRLSKDNSWSHGPNDTMIKYSKGMVVGIATAIYYNEDGFMKGYAKIIIDDGEFLDKLRLIESYHDDMFKSDRIMISEYEPSSF